MTSSPVLSNFCLRGQKHLQSLSLWLPRQILGAVSTSDSSVRFFHRSVSNNTYGWHRKHLLKGKAHYCCI